MKRQRSFPERMASAVLLVVYGAELSTTSVKQIQLVAEKEGWQKDQNEIKTEIGSCHAHSMIWRCTHFCLCEKTTGA